MVAMATRKPNLSLMIAVAAGSVLVASACGRSASTAGSVPNTVSPVKGLVAVTRAGAKPVSSVVWATNRDVISLDPIFALGYPEYTAESLMCESLLRQAPDGSLKPGLATVSNPSPTTLVFTLRPGVRFWDGHPVTSADVVYSLGRQMNPKLGGSYGWVFDRVASISATSQDQVTVTLKQPDYWLENELSSAAGIIIEKSFAEKQGKNYGTPAGSIMCTGAYMLKSWTPGVGVVAVRNPHYWNPSVHPLIGQITIKGVPNIASVTAGLETGAIQGDYDTNDSTLNQLERSGNVKVYLGPGWTTDALVVANLKGVLGNLNVRRALSLALNRQGIIDSVYEGVCIVAVVIAVNVLGERLFAQTQAARR
jgi:peptide/nickel transport system substrate-binding protein